MVAYTEILRQLAGMLEVNRELRDEYHQDSARLEEIQQLAREQVEWVPEDPDLEAPAVIVTLLGMIDALHAIILSSGPPTPEDAPQSIRGAPSTKGADDPCSSQGRQGEVQEGDSGACAGQGGDPAEAPGARDKIPQ